MKVSAFRNPKIEWICSKEGFGKNGHITAQGNIQWIIGEIHILKLAIGGLEHCFISFFLSFFFLFVCFIDIVI